MSNSSGRNSNRKRECRFLMEGSIYQVYTSCSSFVDLTRVRTYIELDHPLVNLWATVVLQSFGEHTNVLFATHCACKQDRTLKTPCERSGPHKKNTASYVFRTIVN